jgi:hypothetical protein
MERVFTPPVGTVLFGLNWPVWGSTVKVEMLLERELATKAKRGAAGLEIVLYPPQPVNKTARTNARTELAILLTDMAFLCC